MGGRGTFAAGNPVPYSYQTVATIEGVKVLVGVNGKHGLPEEAHTSSAYISLHQNGNVKQLRLYNSNLTAKTDVEYSVHQGYLKRLIFKIINRHRLDIRLYGCTCERVYAARMYDKHRHDKSRNDAYCR